MISPSKNVCFFGIYDAAYARNHVLINGFKQNSFSVTECKVSPIQYPGIKKYFKLFSEYKKIRNISFEYIIVAFPGHSVVWFVWLLFFKQRGRIIFDAFLSLFDSNVRDRRIYHWYSLHGMRDWLLDWSSCFFASKILLDTDQHIDFFVKKFHISRNKFISLPIGANEQLFSPRVRVNAQEQSKKIIHFHGTFIPLQGIKTIIGAAELAKNDPWIFRLVGSGQEFSIIEKMIKDKELTNAHLVGRVALEQIPEYVNDSDVCLGIFGVSEKALSVIPNKVYECLAMNKPIITADTPAIRKYFNDGKELFLTVAGSSKSLYSVLNKVLNDNTSSKIVSNNGFALFKKLFTSRVVVVSMLKLLKYEGF